MPSALSAPFRHKISPAETSRKASRLLASAGGLALVAALVVAGSPASAAPGDEHLVGLEYVALGDSYAAGLGLTPLSGTPVPGCGQSSTNYPHLVAAEFGLTLTDVTCSGAETINLTTTTQTVPGGSAPVQNDSLSSTTDIVTVTIGGNDVGFIELMTLCSAQSSVGPVLGNPFDPFQVASCEIASTVGGTDLIDMAIAASAAALNATFADIALKAPNAKVFVVGYPALTPDPAGVPAGVHGCFTPIYGPTPAPYSGYPYTVTDVPYLHAKEVAFNLLISTAAAANGATMVSIFDDSVAHSPCATADRYVNDITVTALDPATGAPSALSPASLHPSAAGAEFQANQVMTAIRAAFPAPTVPDPSTDPAVDPAAEDILPVTGSSSAAPLALSGAIVLLLGGVVLVGLRRYAAK